MAAGGWRTSVARSQMSARRPANKDPRSARSGLLPHFVARRSAALPAPNDNHNPTTASRQRAPVMEGDFQVTGSAKDSDWLPWVRIRESTEFHRQERRRRSQPRCQQRQPPTQDRRGVWWRQGCEIVRRARHLHRPSACPQSGDTAAPTEQERKWAFPRRSISALRWPSPDVPHTKCAGFKAAVQSTVPKVRNWAPLTTGRVFPEGV